jgi:hypothetical protein
MVRGQSRLKLMQHYLKKRLEPRMVAHVCNSEGRDQEAFDSRSAMAKKVSKTLISINKLGMVVHFCNPS